MQVVLVRVTARRTREGLETIRREVVGICREEADEFISRTARILAPAVTREWSTAKRRGKEHDLRQLQDLP
ncbi:hypothetical protein [Desulfovirgula thermocuniculi]|uniref:hypothetical protein n=1 Tax=Desulfovirgula thermocuniculi TaxID=348842 RepID=UPI0012EBCDDC|nr:hypothetical protein [Desulfovirgula thermocuniculi]